VQKLDRPAAASSYRCGKLKAAHNEIPQMANMLSRASSASSGTASETDRRPRRQTAGRRPPALRLARRTGDGQRRRAGDITTRRVPALQLRWQGSELEPAALRVDVRDLAATKTKDRLSGR
jgi:hypothetical protein